MYFVIILQVYLLASKERPVFLNCRVVVLDKIISKAAHCGFSIQSRIDSSIHLLIIITEIIFAAPTWDANAKILTHIVRPSIPKIALTKELRLYFMPFS